jgi:hypothetical protein
MEHAVTRRLDEEPAFIASAVLAEAIAETDLDWPVDPGVVQLAEYPE